MPNYTDFHVNFLAKARGMDVLGYLVGAFGTEESTQLTAERIERDEVLRRGVVIDLIRDGYLTVWGVGNSNLYLVTDKALDYVQLKNPFSLVGFKRDGGTLNVGGPRVLVSWMPVDVIASIINGLEEETLSVLEGEGGGLEVELSDDGIVDEIVIREWRAIATELCGGVSMKDLPVPRTVGGFLSEISAYRDQCRKGLAASSCFLDQVDKFGGEDAYLAACGEFVAGIQKIEKERG